MPNIPDTINDVAVKFAPAVKKNVRQTVIDALEHCIVSNVAPGHALNTIFVSSARRNGTGTSRHNSGLAVDISRIDGVRLIVGFPTDPKVKAIVTAIQNRFETFAERRENFGPALKKKLGAPFEIDDHEDHIHMSVNG